NLADEDRHVADFRRAGEELVERAGEIARRAFLQLLLERLHLVLQRLDARRQFLRPAAEAVGQLPNNGRELPIVLDRLRPGHCGDAAYPLGDAFLAGDLEQASLACARQVRAAAELDR